jgi:uncharacterized protein (DUF1501 family)
MSSITRRNLLRRSLLGALGGSSFTALSAQFNLAHAQAAGDDYRALVCVFLYGGNDAFNMVIPESLAEYNTYASTRRSLAIPRDQLLKLAPTNWQPADYALHPEMPLLRDLFQQQKLAVIGNLGTLIEPTTQADYVNKRVQLPPQLFSHNDQQNYVMSLQATKPQQGWASRMADLMMDVNPNARLSMNISLSGANSLQAGGLQAPYAMGTEGVLDYWSLQPGNPETWSVRRNKAYDALLAKPYSHEFANAFARVQRRSLDLGVELRGALEQTAAPVTEFNTQSRLAAMLKMVAHMIAARERIGVRRQIFFVGIGDYDTHGDQANRHPLLMRELNHSLASFYQATVELGVADQVTTFTASDFGRTLTSNGDGTDHGWGSHQLVLGGAVAGGQIVGKMPELAIGSVDDIGEGRIIPTTSIDQYSATLARWYGLDAAGIAQTFPNLVNFNAADLGFMV